MWCFDSSLFSVWLFSIAFNLIQHTDVYIFILKTFIQCLPNLLDPRALQGLWHICPKLTVLVTKIIFMFLFFKSSLIKILFWKQKS